MAITKELEQRLEKVKGLPSPPRIAMQIIAAAQDPDTNLATVADVVTSDPVISAKIMRMANSAAYTTRGGCTTLRRALLKLGLDATLVIALSFSLVVSLKRDKTMGLDHEYFWRRSLLSATAASALAKALKRNDSEVLFLASLLQDIGMLALDKCEPELYSSAPELARNHEELRQHEVECLGCSHTDVGRWLLTRWNLPENLVDAVACSHEPAAENDDEYKRCVALSGPLADVWLASDWALPFRELVAMAQQSLNLDKARLSVVLDELRSRVPETEAMFEKDLLNPLDGIKAMEEAREMLTERGVEDIIADLNEPLRSDSFASAALLRLPRWIEVREMLEKEFKSAAQTGQDVGVVIAGLAGLGHVREMHGSATVDRLLSEATRTILANFGSAFIAQYNADQLILWLADCDHEEAQSAGAHILREFQQVLSSFSDEHDARVSLALGIAAMDSKHRYDNAVELITAGQAALKTARFGSFATT